MHSSAVRPHFHDHTLLLTGSSMATPRPMVKAPVQCVFFVCEKEVSNALFLMHTFDVQNVWMSIRCVIVACSIQ